MGAHSCPKTLDFICHLASLSTIMYDYGSSQDRDNTGLNLKEVKMSSGTAQTNKEHQALKAISVRGKLRVVSELDLGITHLPRSAQLPFRINKLFTFRLISYPAKVDVVFITGDDQ